MKLFLFSLLIAINVHAAPYSVKSSLKWVKQLADVSNCVIKNEEFLKEVEAFPKYDFTTKTSKEVAQAYRSSAPSVISTYKTKNPWSKAIATTYTGDSKTIYLNLRKNPRPLKEMVNTAIHERGHGLGFSHGDNSSWGKENSVNYRVGLIAEKYVEKCK
jgi:hypothetical protein